MFISCDDDTIIVTSDNETRTKTIEITNLMLLKLQITLKLVLLFLTIKNVLKLKQMTIPINIAHIKNNVIDITPTTICIKHLTVAFMHVKVIVLITMYFIELLRFSGSRFYFLS